MTISFRHSLPSPLRDTLRIYSPPVIGIFLSVHPHLSHKTARYPTIRCPSIIEVSLKECLTRVGTTVKGPDLTLDSVLGLILCVQPFISLHIFPLYCSQHFSSYMYFTISTGNCIIPSVIMFLGLFFHPSFLSLQIFHFLSLHHLTEFIVLKFP